RAILKHFRFICLFHCFIHNCLCRCHIRLCFISILFSRYHSIFSLCHVLVCIGNCGFCFFLFFFRNLYCLLSSLIIFLCLLEGFQSGVYIQIRNRTSRRFISFFCLFICLLSLSKFIFCL